jgi:acetyl esterase/lipase
MVGAAIVTLHGGCFVGGSSGLDKEQTQLLTQLGYTVYQLDFNKECLSKCLEDIRRQVAVLQKQHGKNLHVLGRSSGGYMAKVLFDEGWFTKAIYLAPVLNPIERGKRVPKLGDKAAPFFAGEQVPVSDKWTPEKELLCLAKEDENVPLECYTHVQKRHAIYLGPTSHSGLVTTTSADFVAMIQKHIRTNE